MDYYDISVIFRKDRFTQHNTSDKAIIGSIQMETDRCDVEAILASYNVDEYWIRDCTNPLQIMEEPKKMPEHYYKED